MTTKTKLGNLGQNNQTLIVIILAAVFLRLSAALFAGNSVEVLPGTWDQISYHNLALRVIDGHGFSFGQLWWPVTPAGEPTAHWSYLYTLYLAGVYKLFGPNPLVARVFQAVIVGILQPYLVYLIGRHVFGQKVGLTAAGLTTIYAYFIYYPAALMTESFYITAILACLFLAIKLAQRENVNDRWLGLGLGIVLGTTVLLRQLFLVFVPVLFLWLWWVRFRRTRRLPITSTVIAGVVLGAMILPFTVYNYARFDRFVLLNTNAGFAFFWGNHPIYGTRFEAILPPEMGSYQDLIPEELRQLNEAALERALMKRGIQFVLDDPVRYAQLSISRIPHYFMFWPLADSDLISNIARVASFGLLLPLMLYGLIISFSQKFRLGKQWNSIVLLLLFAGFYTGIHLLSWTLIRYRLPVDAVLLIFAGLAIVDIAGRISHALQARQQLTASRH